ncbi:hypothetical protein DUNSADRAFT_15534 [Dunaliella salina]|uniref:Guanylate cyclase domain-containing protein n=1 Tax=Dunaliella salina TaxID=3046 RepID=A0ABQ7G597_DUNSA|nr:hypothetical protein DUNSADRAFT_15534 [Dunaliella salina]|eukprot:KAF5829769.1 hypothetical protein DUNSADRAFT_15534 [Dunaliella salina]
MMPPLKTLALCFSGGAKAKGKDEFSCCDYDSVPIKESPKADTHQHGGDVPSSCQPPFKEAPLTIPALSSPNLLSGTNGLSKSGPAHPPASKQPSITRSPGPLPDAPPGDSGASPPCPNPQNAHVEAMALRSMPLSLAVISSDAKEVIYHRFGLDAGAAQLLKQTLQFNKSCSGGAHALAMRDTAQPTGKSPSTFLATLLGPEVEAVALREARSKRFWKGTVSVQLPAHAPPSELSGSHHSSARQSPAEVLPIPPASMAAAAAAAAARSNAFSAPLPEVEARYASGQPFTLVGPSSCGATNADAAIKCTSFSVLKLAAQASGPEAEDTMVTMGSDLQPGHLAEATDAPPTELSHGPSTGGTHQNERSSKSVQWVIPAEPEGMRSAFEASAEASTVPGEAHSRTPPTSEEHDVKSFSPGPEFSGGSFMPLGRRSCPGYSVFQRTETDAVGDKEGSKKKESCSKDARKRRAMKKCKSLYDRTHSNRCSLLRPEAIKQLVHESKNEECTRTVALLKSISVARRSATDDDQACVSAPQQSVHESRSDALPHASPWVDLRSFLSEQSAFPQAEKTQQRSGESSDFGQRGCNVPHQRPASTPTRQPVQLSKQAANSAVQTLDQPTFDRKTSEQPTSACHTAESIRGGVAGLSPPCSSGRARDAGQDSHLSVPDAEPTAGTGRGLAVEPDNRPSWSQRLTAHDRFSRASSQTLECLRDCPLSFDVSVSVCRPEEGNRSPLLVVICNSTEHSQVRTTLTALAESQLELLSSALPQHAIQFLAMQSVEAVPENVGQLARAHQDVTIMFMDIVGFTEMSKNCKPVEVMVFLNTLFSMFDRLVDIHGVHKVETAGDCYIVSGGIMSPSQSGKGFGLVVEEKHDPKESAKRVMEFAKALLETAGQVRMPDTHQPVQVRVGLHTGDAVTGLIGSKLPKFSIFGDTMCTASRMESTGLPGRIHVSEATRALLQHEQWEATGGIEVKGKGLMDTYLWAPSSQQPSVSRAASSSADRLPCMLLMHAHMLLRQFSSPPSPFQKKAAYLQNSTPGSPSNPPSRHLGERTLTPAVEVDEHELEQDE